jgi:hypothetical protein
MLRRFVGPSNASAGGEVRGGGGGRSIIGARLFGRGGSFDENDAEFDEETVIDDSMRTVETNITPTPIPVPPKKVVSTQVLCSPAADPVQILQKAHNEITALSIFFKEVEITQPIAANFVELIRGDNRSWEAIAVDILRQKARWESITFASCKNTTATTSGEGEEAGAHNTNFMDICISFVLTLDNCTYLHLSSLLLTEQLSKSFTALSFSKSIQKLELDLIDLTFCVPLLAEALAHNTSLTCLITTRCGLQDDGLKLLIGSLPSQLKELRIFGNKCRGLGLEALANCLQDPSRNLEILDISFQHVQDDETENAFDVACLAAALQKNTTLKVLDMDNDNLDDGHFAHLVAALEINSTLEELTLNHNKISMVGMALMASKFGSLKGLKKISMYSNAFN